MKILSCLLLIALSLLCEHLEAKSRKWYPDRVLLRLSGVFAGAAVVVVFL